MHIFHFDGSWQKYMPDPQIKGNLRFPVKMREGAWRDEQSLFHRENLKGIKKRKGGEKALSSLALNQPQIL